MRKLISCLVVCFMLLTSFTAFTAKVSSVKGADGNQPATFIANRFVKVGFDRDGLPLYPARMFPWQTSSDMPVWGRSYSGYPMPNAAQAVAYMETFASVQAVTSVEDSRGLQYEYKYNFPAQNGESKLSSSSSEIKPVSTDVMPVAWTSVFLSVVPAGGKSQEYDEWFVVLDSSGQLWFDPDGTFHDSRINPFTHPESPLYDLSDRDLEIIAIDGNSSITTIVTPNPYHEDAYNDAVCKRYGVEIDGITRYCIDPISNNNTQGPYIINDYHDLFSATQCVIDTNYQQRSYANWQFMDMEPTRRDEHFGKDFSLVLQVNNTRYGTRQW
ncbi:MAG: hypothetical protein KAH01_07325, partial [Caldisericia bacterium]|nr:hypothetical protein [Caldisericia bacterium]